MKKYIKPSIEIISFDVKSSVMAYAESSTEIASQSDLSETSNNYIPDTVDRKVWTQMDDENWNWE